MRTKESGFTLIELMVSLLVLSILALAFFDLFNALLNSALVAQKKATALTLANTQMEYLKSLPYSNLAISGGPILANSYLPASFSKTVNGLSYTVKTNITYVDDAYDGCGSYPSLALEEEYCRNYPPPPNAPNPGNAADYKDVRVDVSDSKTGVILASLDSYISPGITGSTGTYGTLFVKVIDNNGNPVQGATVKVVNNALDPVVNVGDTTDQNGMAIFYNLPPDKKYDYVVSASDTGYSSITTIASQGSLVPTYPNQKLISQSSSLVTLMIAPQGEYSLLVQSTDVNNNPLPGATIYIKGGYKMYTSSSNTQYYYDTINSGDSPTTDSNGLVGITNLAPGGYYFCGDNGSTGCSVNGTTYYLAAAVPYSGNNPLEPVVVPSYLSSSPPSTTFPYNGNDYLQEVRLMLTTSSTFPRVTSLNPYDGSLSSGNLSNFNFVLDGANLPSRATSSSCATSVSFTQNGTSYPASCTGSSGGTSLSCDVNLANTTTGNTQLVVSSNGQTLTLPASPLLGGIIIVQ